MGVLLFFPLALLVETCMACDTHQRGSRIAFTALPSSDPYVRDSPPQENFLQRTFHDSNTG